MKRRSRSSGQLELTFGQIRSASKSTKRINKYMNPKMAIAVGTIVSAASPTAMKCTLTGKEVKTCCCEQQKNGKMFCKLAKKEIDKCCCEGM